MITGTPGKYLPPLPNDNDNEVFLFSLLCDCEKALGHSFTITKEAKEEDLVIISIGEGGGV